MARRLLWLTAMHLGRSLVASFLLVAFGSSLACGGRTSLGVGTYVEVDAGRDVRPPRDAAPERIDAAIRPTLPLPKAIFAVTSDFDFRDRLYRFDPVAKTLTLVGKINGCVDVADIAIDRSGRAFISVRTGFARLDLETGACTMIASGSYPYALEALPANVIGPAEALVGFRNDEYVQVDPGSGAITTLGILPYPALAGDVTYTATHGLVAALYTADAEHLLFPVDAKSGAPAKPINVGGQVVDFEGTAPWGWTLYAFGGYAGIYAIDTYGDAWSSEPVEYTVTGGGDPLLPFTGAAPLW